MVKKFKTKEYEKDNDDHFVVIINPWANSPQTPRTQPEVDWIGAWLRIAFRRPEANQSTIRAVFTLDKRDEVIVQLNPCVEIEVGLGAHKWDSFLKREWLDNIEQRQKVRLHDRVSYIFMYNWKRNGDPGEHQWKWWSPRQDCIPDHIPVQRPYPNPCWSSIPFGDQRLHSLLLPLPRKTSSYPNPSQPLPAHLLESPSTVAKLSNYEPDQPGVTDARLTPSRGTSAHPAHSNPSLTMMNHRVVKTEDADTISYSKADKLDPYQEDETAREALRVPMAKEEVFDDVIDGLSAMKRETADIKPDINNEQYRPSNSLIEAFSKLHDGLSEEEEHKPIIKSETSEYQPSRALLDALSTFPKSSSDNLHLGGQKRGIDEDNVNRLPVNSSETHKRIKREDGSMS